MRQPLNISCNKSNYPLADCLPKSRRTSTRKRYGVRPRHAKLFDALESAGWKKSYRLFSALKRKREEQASLPPENIAAIALLRSWRDEDSQEQRETWEFLKQAIDEDRLSDRKFFP